LSGNSGRLRASNVPSIVRKSREKIEKEVMERRKRGEKGKVRMNEFKFILANLLVIEWKIIHGSQSTEFSFIKDILLPLSEEILSIEEEKEEKEEEEIFLPPDSFNGDPFILSTIWESSLFSDSSLYAYLLCCSERKVLFGNIISHSLFPSPPSTRLSSLEIIQHLFFRGSIEEVKWVMREGGMNVVLKKMREKKEREEEVWKSNVEGMKKFLHSSYYGRKRRREETKGMKEMREGRWKIEREGGCDSLISFLSSPFGKENANIIGGLMGMWRILLVFLLLLLLLLLPIIIISIMILLLLFFFFFFFFF
jgi:hypothetical protein